MTPHRAAGGGGGGHHSGARRGVPGEVRGDPEPCAEKALRDLARCRTAELGGHVDRCLDCGHDRIAYNSCRNRHCPKCQALTRARWLAARRSICCRSNTSMWCSRCPMNWRFGTRQSIDVLRSVVPVGGGDDPRSRGQPEAAGRRAGRVAGVAHLGPELAPSSACAWRRHRRRPIVRCNGTDRCVAALGLVPAGFLPAGACAEPRVSRQVSRRLAQGPSPRRIALLRHARGVGRRRRVPCLAASLAMRRTGSSTPSVRLADQPSPEVPGPLHASRRHQQLADRKGGRWPRDLPVQGLRRRAQVEDDDVGCSGVPASLRAHVLPKGFMKIRHYGLLANRFRAERLKRSGIFLRKRCRRRCRPKAKGKPSASTRARDVLCEVRQSSAGVPGVAANAGEYIVASRLLVKWVNRNGRRPPGQGACAAC